MRGVVVALACLTLLAAPASAAHTRASLEHESWAKAAIASVTRHGLFPGTPATFRPTDPLTAGALDSLLIELGSTHATVASAPAAPISIAGLDAALVDALGLRGSARALYRGAVRAGLHPPGRFGTEVVARLLGLRTDLPIVDDSFELQPAQTATRADAAFSAARVLSLALEVPGGKPAPGLDPLAAADAGGGVQYVKGIAAGFALPRLTQLQRQVLGTAVSLIGYPYVWGGDDERLEPGFDCSGFVWRVFKLASYPDAPGLGAEIPGRTAADMAGEVTRSARIHRAGLEPGDVLFFGNGPRSKPSQIDHTAIYLGNDWMIESSGQGVSLGRLDWYSKTFAWARRLLVEPTDHQAL